MLRIWGEKANAPVQSVHLSFGIGALLAAQVARPWLADRPDDVYAHVTDNAAVANQSLQNSFETQNASLSIPYRLGEHDAIEYPYTIIAGVTLLAAVPFAVMQIVAPVQQDDSQLKPTSILRMMNPKSWISSDKSTLLGFSIVSLICVFSVLGVGSERAMARFLYAFAVESRLRFTPKDAATLETVFWASFTISRVLMTIGAKWISAGTLLTVDVVINVVSTAALAVYGEQFKLVTWIFCVGYSLSLAALIPTMMTWANTYIDMAGMMTSLVFIFGAAGSFIFSWLAGYLFQFVGPITLMQLLLTVSLATLVSFALMRLLGRKYGPRYATIDQGDTTVDKTSTDL